MGAAEGLGALVGAPAVIVGGHGGLLSVARTGGRVWCASVGREGPLGIVSARAHELRGTLRRVDARRSEPSGSSTCTPSSGTSVRAGCPSAVPCYVRQRARWQREFREGSPRRGGVGTGVQVEIWSDVACPWCYVGHAAVRAGRRGDRCRRRRRLPLLRARPDRAARAATARRWSTTSRGSSATAAGCRPPTPGSPTPAPSSASTSGGRGMRRANTFDAHRLLAWALHTHGAEPAASAEAGAAARVLHRRRATWPTTPCWPTWPRTSASTAAAAAALLASDDEADFVRAEREEAYGNGINAVPTFIVEGAVDAPGRPRHRQVGQGPHPHPVGAGCI